MESNTNFWADSVAEAMSFAVLQPKDPRAESEASFGLIEEAGEVAGVFKREARGDAGGLDMAKLTKEAGDLWWYTVRTALVCQRMGHQEIAQTFDRLSRMDGGRMDRLMVPYVLGRMYQERTEGRARGLFQLSRHAGLDMREVVATNLDKLRARKKAGTIQGSGDR